MFRVMVVDDEEIIRKGIEFLIDWSDIDCRIIYFAENGNDAKNWLETHPESVEIVVSDIRMPGFNGLMLADYIARNFQRIQVILLTAYEDFTFAQDAIHYGVIDYVLKSHIEQALPDAIKKAKSKIQEKDLDLERKNKLEFFEKKNESGKLDGFLRSLVEQRNVNIAELDGRLPTGYYIISYEIIFQNEKPVNRQLKAESNIISVAYKDLRHATVFVNNDHYCSLLFIDENKANDNKLTHICEDVITVVEQYMKAKVLVGISDYHADLNHATEAYRESLNSLSRVIRLSMNIIFYKDAVIEENADQINIDKYIQELQDHFLTGDTSAWNAQIEEYKNIFVKSSISLETLKLHSILIFNAVYTRANQMDILYSDEPGELFYSKIEKVKSAFMVFEVLNEQLTLFEARYKLAHGGQTRLIRQITQYIRENYQKNISLHSIADLFQINNSYLSRLYRRETGLSVINAINQHRIEIAKQLLQDPTLRISEIAQSTGFAEPAYFTQVFIKYTGENPRSYRNR